MARFRKILHVDLDAFFCAVEEKLNPSLKGQAFAVGGSPEGRGVVTSCSYAARKHGIRSAMPMSRAIRVYPSLKVIQSHYREYVNSSRQVMSILQSFTPLFEQVSIDEAFLDVTDLPQPGMTIAREIQSKIFNDLGLPCSIGIASNKLVAKIATNIGKSGQKKDTAPLAILEVTPGNEKVFLATLPIDEMWGIGPKTATLLKGIGIFTIGDVQQKSEKELEANLGKYGRILFSHANGFDERPVAEMDGIKSISNEITFYQDKDNEVELLETLTGLCRKVGYRLRKSKLAGYTVRFKIRWPDFQTQTRQLTLPQPTSQDSVILSSARQLFSTSWKKGMRVRLMGVGVSQLCDDFQQLSLFEHQNEKEKRLLEAVDELHIKYGDKAIQRGMRSSGFRDWKD
jgi:DNA polymerase IV